MIRRWFVVETRIQAEAKATASLRARGYRVYEPMMRKTVIHHRTKQPIEKRYRLFARYLFVSLPWDYHAHIGKVRACQGVEDILGMDLDGRACEIDRRIVRRFMMAQKNREFDDVIPFTKRQMAAKLPIGSRVRITRHHIFGGYYGLVTRIKGRGVILATIEMFARLVSVELGSGAYQRVREDAA